MTRLNKSVPDAFERLRFADFVLDISKYTLTDAGGRDVPLRRSEFALLRAFLRAPGRVLSRDHLLDATSGRLSERFDRSIDMLVSRLRRKVEAHSRSPRLILTVPGLGYKFTAKPEVVQTSTETRWRCQTEVAPAQSDRHSMIVRPFENLTELAAAPDKPSIAVLPFQNMSGDPEQEYFSDGLADDVITELSRNRALLVIARNSSFTYRGRAIDIRQVGRELGVRYVLEGSVRRDASRIRVLAQLIGAETGSNLWAERYDRVSEHGFAVQDEITAAVVTAIIPTIADAETKRVLRKLPESLGAWETCQRGLWHLAKHTPTGTNQAQHFFMRANELDALLATPHALLAGCYMQRLGFGVANHEMAEEEAWKALALDPEDTHALATLSAVSLYKCGDYEAALEHADHAFSVNPYDFGAYLCRGRALAFGGRPGEAEEQLLTALRLGPRDPLKSSALNTLAVARYFRGDYAGAAKLEQRAIRDYPGYPVPHKWLAASLGQLNRTDEARAALRQAIAISPTSFDFFVQQRQPCFRPEDHEHMLAGLRKADWRD
jgi:adenylate cyclase